MHDTNLLEDQPIAWTPTPDVIERAQLTRFMRQVGVTTWDELYEFSIRDVEKFTEEVLKFLDIRFDPPYEKVLDTSDGIEFPNWFVSPQRRGDAEAVRQEPRDGRQESEPGAVAPGSPADNTTTSDSSELPPRIRSAQPPLLNKEGSFLSEPGVVATGSAANAERGVRNAESTGEPSQHESEPGAVATGSAASGERGVRNAESGDSDSSVTHHSSHSAGLNITTMCLDRWQTDDMKDQPAVIWEGEEGDIRSVSYSDLLANVDICVEKLADAQIGRGDAVGIHLPMLPETVVALLAINRIGAIAVPVFSGYGIEAIASRLNAVQAKGLFTCYGASRRGKYFDMLSIAADALKLAPSIESVFVSGGKTVSECGGPKEFAKNHTHLIEETFQGRRVDQWGVNRDLIAFLAPESDAAETSAEDPLIILYTSGTTGKPKGIAHTHASFPIKAAQDMAFGTDVGRGTRICWYTDIGWMMGPWLIYGALINGATICIYDGAPDYPTPDRMWEFCAKHKVEILGISPTLIRALAAHEETGREEQVPPTPESGSAGAFPQSRKAAKKSSPPSEGGVAAASADGVVHSISDVGFGNSDVNEHDQQIRNPKSQIPNTKPPHQRHDLSHLRAFASTGEPWNPAPWWWLFKEVGNGKLPIINYSGGTEIAGGILMGNPLLPIKPCSFPAPCPGMDVDILDEEGNPVKTGQVGELVIKQPWIGMARGFWQERERYLDTYWRRFPNIWVHGDWAMRDKDGHWFILGRSDDTLKVAGKRVGPAEVESLLVAHPLVTEAAVIGVPDEKKGTAMVAFCVVKDEGGRMKDEAEVRGLKSQVPDDSSFILPPSSLEAELKALVAKDMGKPLAPSRVLFVSALPKTRNAKVMRRVLRSAYLGEDAGDLSALENPQAVEEIRSLSA